MDSMLGGDRQFWVNRLSVALILLAGVALIVGWAKTAFDLLDRYPSGFIPGVMLANALLLLAAPLVRSGLRRFRSAFGGAVPWDARGYLKSGLSLDDYAKSITTGKTLRQKAFTYRFNWWTGAFIAVVAALITWMEIDRSGSTVWIGLLVGFGTMSALLVSQTLLMLVISWIRRWALGPELVGRPCV
jgi:hypothetical protein